MNGAIEFWNGAAAAWWAWTVTATWQGAVLLAVVAALLFAAKSLRPGLRYGLLLVVLLKLAMPPVVGISYGFSDLLSRFSTSTSAVSTGDASMTVTIEPATMEAGAVIAPGMAREGRAPLLNRHGWLLVVQLLGVLALLAHIGRQFVLLRYLRMGAESASEAHCGRLQHVAERMGLHQLPELRVSDQVRAPQASGLWRPCIILPAWVECMSTEALDILLAHELAHVKRRDALINGIQAIIQALLWWNPLVWWLNRRIREEREYCCDDLVLERGITTGAAYSRTLVTVAERISIPSSQWGAVGMADAFHVIDQRVRRAMNDRRAANAPLRYVSLLALLLLAGWILPGTSQGREGSEAPLPSTAERPVAAEIISAGEELVEISVALESPTAVTEGEALSEASAPIGEDREHVENSPNIQASATSGTSLSIKADRVNQKSDAVGSRIWTFDGNVMATWRDFKISAARSVSRDDGLVEFEDARVDGPGMEGMSAALMQIDTKTGTFTLNQGRAASAVVSTTTIDVDTPLGPALVESMEVTVEKDGEETTVTTRRNRGEEEAISQVEIPKPTGSSDRVRVIDMDTSSKVEPRLDRSFESEIEIYTEEDSSPRFAKSQVLRPRVYRGAQFYEGETNVVEMEVQEAESPRASEGDQVEEEQIQIAQVIPEPLEIKTAEVAKVAIKISAKISEVDPGTDLGLPAETHMYASEGTNTEALQSLDGNEPYILMPYLAGTADDETWAATESILRDLAEAGKAKQVGAPRLTVLSGEEATITVSTEIPYENGEKIEQKSVGYTLKIIASPTENEGKIALQFNHMRTVQRGEVDGKPVFTEREVKGTMEVENHHWAYFIAVMPGQRHELIALKAELVTPAAQG